MTTAPYLTLSKLTDALARDAAFRRVRRLQPVGGVGDKIFPPTYPAARQNDPPRHVFERRRVDGREAWCVLVDSVQSQANRLEEALLSAAGGDGLRLPYVTVDFSGAGLQPLERITSLEAPHRVYDAILRDSLLDGEPLMQTDQDGASRRQSPRMRQRYWNCRRRRCSSAPGIAKVRAAGWAPSFRGLWSPRSRRLIRRSTTGGLATRTRVPRVGGPAAASIRWAFRRTSRSIALPTTTRTGRRARLKPPGPMRVRFCFLARRRQGGQAVGDQPRERDAHRRAARRDLRLHRASRRRHVGRTATAAFRQRRPQCLRTGAPCRARPPGAGRTGCQRLRSAVALRPGVRGERAAGAGAADGSTEIVEHDRGQARSLYEEAYAQAESAGFRFQSLTLKPQDKLIDIVRRSRDLALEGAGGEGDDGD